MCSALNATLMGARGELDPSQQEFQDKCMQRNVNTFLDTVQHLTFSYGDCKGSCLREDPELKNMIEAESYRLFDPTSSDPCISQCKSAF